jgi:hypothetical protein
MFRPAARSGTEPVERSADRSRKGEALKNCGQRRAEGLRAFAWSVYRGRREDLQVANAAKQLSASRARHRQGAAPPNSRQGGWEVIFN